MLFNTWTFAIFFLVVWGLYVVLNTRWQNYLLLVASYVFYGTWDWRFTGLLFLSTVIDYYAGLALASTDDPRRRKLFLLVSLTSNFTILGFFKYFNFFVDSFAELLTAVGFTAHLPTLNIILPVGISFYTFQSVSYAIDIYRRELEPTRNLATFALFVSYFPQLVAGPIERATALLPQVISPRIVRADYIASGSLLFLIGMIRKVAIADNLAPSIDKVYANSQSHGGAELLIGTLAFALQIYGDFGGYSDMARGVSRFFGIELMENFNRPYFATNVSFFWRRWHISLSTWLRDYLYIPLGGNRGTKVATYRNLMLTMLLGGLWHGANWTFVIWGGIHGLALAAHRAWSEWRKKHTQAQSVSRRGLISSSFVTAPVAWFLTMVIVLVTWVFFRAQDMHSALDILQGIFTWRTGGGSVREPLLALLGCGALMLFIDIPQEWSWNHTVMLKWPLLIRGAVYAVLILILVIFRPEADVPFIYFQF